MAHEDTERDRAVRAMLVDRVQAPVPARSIRLRPERFRAALVTAVVLVAIVALSVVAVRFGTDRGAPADGGVPPTPTTDLDGLRTPTPPAGKLLGRFTSADGPVQHHTIRPDGLSVWLGFTCSGGGQHDEYMIHLPHVEDEGGGCNGASAGRGNKGVRGALTVSITTTKAMRWTLTIVGVPETYVTPKPIPTPTDSAGRAVRYCTAADLSVRFSAHAMPGNVSAANGGELVFTDTTRTACALAGYPEVRFLDHGTALGHTTMNAIDVRSSTDHGLRAVVLAPGGHAYSQVAWAPPGENAKEEGPCQARTLTAVQVDLAYDLSSPGQTGTFDVPIGTATACLNGAHGALGKYGQISSTVFVDYSLADVHQ